MEKEETIHCTCGRHIDVTVQGEIKNVVIREADDKGSVPQN